jgi:cell division topological specificity factor
MNFFSRWLAPRTPDETTAPVARERLQVLLAHERQKPGEPNLLGLIKDDILSAITRHVEVEPEDVKVKVDRRKAISTMRITLDLPR